MKQFRSQVHVLMNINEAVNGNDTFHGSFERAGSICHGVKYGIARCVVEL